MAKFCTNCGKEIAEGIAFCTECGTPAPKEDAAAQQPAKELVMAAAQTPPAAQPVKEATAQPQQTYQQPVYQQPAQQTYVPTPPQEASPKGGRYGVVSTGAYFGLMLLFAIPVIGWIVCIIMAFTPKNENIKHFAKAMLIWIVIGIVLSVAAYFVFRWLSGSITDYINQATDGAFGDWKDIFGQLDGIKNGDFSSIPTN